MKTKVDNLNHLMNELQEQSTPKAFIRCRLCTAAICSEADLINVNGHALHHFINPQQMDYQLGCFRSAAGCDIYGEPTIDFTWFPDFRWQLALCTECQEHLGWYYQNPIQVNFFGLIVDKLQWPAE